MQAKKVFADARINSQKSQADKELAQSEKMSADASAEKSQAEAAQQEADKEMALAKKNIADAADQESRAKNAQQKADSISDQSRKAGHESTRDRALRYAPYVCILILIILLIYVTRNLHMVTRSQTKLHDFMNRLLKDRVNLWKKFDQLDEEARALEQGITSPSRALEEPLIPNGIGQAPLA